MLWVSHGMTCKWWCCECHMAWLVNDNTVKAQTYDLLREYGISHCSPHPILLTQTRSCPLLPPPPAEKIPAWKTVRPRKKPEDEQTKENRKILRIAINSFYVIAFNLFLVEIGVIKLSVCCMNGRFIIQNIMWVFILDIDLIILSSGNHFAVMWFVVCVEKPIQSVHITSPFISYQPPHTDDSTSDKSVAVSVEYCCFFLRLTSSLCTVTVHIQSCAWLPSVDDCFWNTFVWC